MLVRPFRPDPHDAYPNWLITLKFQVQTVEQGRLESKHLLARMVDTRHRKLGPPAGFQTGHVYRLRLEPETPAAYRSSVPAGRHRRFRPAAPLGRRGRRGPRANAALMRDGPLGYLAPLAHLASLVRGQGRCCSTPAGLSGR